MTAASLTRKSIEAGARILIASDSVADADMVRNLLAPEFENFFISTDPDRSAADFESHCPDVIVLAFNDLQKSEGYYLGLFRLSEKIHVQPHRTIILCNKNDVNRVYQACRKEYFDDYILFWPMTHDAPRLLMSVHHALRDLAAIKDAGPSAAEFAAQARRLSEMGNMLEQQIALGNQRIELVNRTILQTEQEVGVALDGFSKKLIQGELADIPKIENAASLEQEIQRLKLDEIKQRFRSATDAVQPFRQWSDEFKKKCEPHIETARALGALAEQIRPTILIVDDDEVQRKMIAKFLAETNYRLEFAIGGVEALNILRKLQPDLILMDIVMAELDGIETTRRLKTMHQLARVPVIMTTGKSEGVSVRDSMKAGATDFVVKPFDRDTLLAKVAHALQPL
jgi:PleD family two-component response regulator